MAKLVNDDLEIVTGGEGFFDDPTGDESETRDDYCPKCREVRTFNLRSGGRGICQTCGEQILI